MPKGKVISLISGSSGKPRYVVAQRGCSCTRCNNPITSGDRCAEIPKLGGAYANWKRYCLNCFTLIVEQTDSDLIKIREELNIVQGN
ncbi:hypothetical protein HGB07_05470 [Candidatus Roizmanbacteria bacterium]|nr:hypothetical protein [Candidatus Roizmanbacteria bacterium]